ncbi:MAG TPA: 3-oxoacyl-[acyl-carrier-protein] synthase III C-terminal domain-containing protein [Nocardioidaceae bacterium]|jgi:alkylresorcinol/alkylpyrone synthase|nr:3-oxoacyl-[acyl-carrier-protein] synthase III C-terminal domain-containing protein [Nocardioidaceae bacterium]
MSRILAARGRLPEHKSTQSEITRVFGDLIVTGEGLDRALLERLHANTGVSSRYTALPIEDYGRLEDFGQSNDVFLSVAPPLGAQAITAALSAAGLSAADVDLLVTTTITGLAVPSLDARIAPLLGLRDDVKRMPLVGLGCLAGAAGLARVHDYLLGHPTEVAVLLSVELCSLTVQRGDTSVANLVASGLFGDGAGAVVLVGSAHPLASGPSGSGPSAPRPRVAASRSRLYPDTFRAMGWDVGSGGLKIVLGAEVPSLVASYVGGDVDAFLDSQGLARSDIEWWVCHPGGPKVLQALEESLGLSSGETALTWESLDRIGNLSSASVLFVLEDTLALRPPRPGSYGLLLAMGPGFALEMVLLQA